MLQNDVGTCSWLVEELTAARIVERSRLEPHLADFTAECPYADADAFAKHLAREGILSKYQAKRAVDGDAKKLIFGAYLLVEVMGNGSLGPVYKAIGRADHLPYAVKVLPRRAWNVRLARCQVRAFEELPSHDGIVPFVDVGTSHGLHYLVWPFVEGQTLESLVREHGPLSPAEVARVGVLLAEALKVGLSRGLIHGLIKPSNVLISPDGQAKLLDFGIGALLAENPDEEVLVDTVSRAGSLAHILECAAPESIADSSKWGPPGDQYSLGCTLYFAATGRYPFPGGGFVEKIVNHQLNKPAPIRSLNPDVSGALSDVIERLMQKMPSDRYHKLDELFGELAPLATVSRVKEPAPVNVQTPAPKKRLVLAPVVTRPTEPPTIELVAAPSKRNFFGRIFGTAEATEDSLHATIVSAGPIEIGAETIVHVYVHGPAEERLLAEAARNYPDQVQILGSGRTRRSIAFGSRVGLHLSLGHATVNEPLQEIEFAKEPTIHCFSLSAPADAPKQPLKGRLMIGQDGRLIAQIEFVFPVVK